MKNLVLISLLALFALITLVYVFPVPFTACEVDSIWCRTCWWYTQSGGKVGTACILVIAAIIYALRIENRKSQITTFFKTLIVLGGLIGIIAFFNEHVTKEVIRQPRPSHLFLTEKNTLITLDSLYKVETEQRKVLLQELIKKDSLRLKSIDPDVLTHWVDEAGFSFPSGHSFNAFLLSAIISWTMYHSRIRWVKVLFWLPSVWAFAVALSRVAIGAHSATDVSVGAALGILLGYTFLYFDTTRRWVTHRNTNLNTSGKN